MRESTMTKNGFVNQWLELASQQQDNVCKFFCLYVPFNYLFNAYSGKEHEQIKEYMKEHSITIENTSFYSELYKNVKDSRSGRIKNYIQTEKNDVIRLCLNVYQVRCNLFHGSKFMLSDRDKSLVKESICFLTQILYEALDQQ